MEPYPYQREGIAFLAARRTALLADEMGLGKSAQVVWAANAIGATRVLVLCPALARRVWEYEWTENGALDLAIRCIETRQDSPLLEGVTVCSYDLAATTRDFEWDLVVLDEAHYLKNVGSKRSQRVYRAICPRAKRVWALSGTPAPNHPGEMYAMMRYLFPDAMEGIRDRSRWAFERRYCTGYDNGFTFKVTGGKNIADLRRRLAPHLLRRRKKDVLTELPPISYHHLPVDAGDIDYPVFFPFAQNGDLDTVQKRIAQDGDLLGRLLNGSNDRGALMPALASLSPSVTTLRRWIGLAKVDAVVQWIEQRLTLEPKVVLFGWHVMTLQHYREILRQKGYKPVLLFGGTPAKKREAALRRFRQDPATKVFIGQIQTAGTAITLTNASTVVFGELDWVPGNNAQAAMRCHRIGQENPVSVYVASLSGTIDERLNRILRQKTAALTELFD